MKSAEEEVGEKICKNKLPKKYKALRHPGGVTSSNARKHLLERLRINMQSSEASTR